ncbi:hypothetical protein SALBM135S_04984 [Streptomyces alboniger]
MTREVYAEPGAGAGRPAPRWPRRAVRGRRRNGRTPRRTRDSAPAASPQSTATARSRPRRAGTSRAVSRRGRPRAKPSLGRMRVASASQPGDRARVRGDCRSRTKSPTAPSPSHRGVVVGHGGARVERRDPEAAVEPGGDGDRPGPPQHPQPGQEPQVQGSARQHGQPDPEQHDGLPGGHGRDEHRHAARTGGAEGRGERVRGEPPGVDEFVPAEGQGERDEGEGQQGAEAAGGEEEPVWTRRAAAPPAGHAEPRSCRTRGTPPAHGHAELCATGGKAMTRVRMYVSHAYVCTSQLAIACAGSPEGLSARSLSAGGLGQRRDAASGRRTRSPPGPS